MARPSASSSAVWKESASRVAMPLADDDAVDHHLDVVLELLVERRGFGDLVELPSIFTRWKPRFISSASSLRYSPLRPRTIGASR